MYMYIDIDILMMMMIAFITIKSGIIPVIEDLRVQIYCFRFEIIGGSCTYMNIHINSVDT